MAFIPHKNDRKVTPKIIKTWSITNKLSVTYVLYTGIFKTQNSSLKLLFSCTVQTDLTIKFTFFGSCTLLQFQ